MGDASPVWLFKEHLAVPVFHLHQSGFDGQASELPDGWKLIENVARTLCGLVTFAWSWEAAPEPGYRTDSTRNYQSRDRGIRLRRDHAEAFGRLCGRCERAEEAS